MSVARKARAILRLAQTQGWTIATAESCTGGMIAAALTDIAGSSAVFDRGFVTYSNEAKRELLGVRADTLEQFGAVSAETAAEMAKGAILRSRVEFALAVTGIAGPGGGTPDKPVGLVWFGLARRNAGVETYRHHFDEPDRRRIRAAATRTGLDHLHAWIAQAMTSRP